MENMCLGTFIGIDSDQIDTGIGSKLISDIYVLSN